jgi:hypothetical protein
MYNEAEIKSIIKTCSAAAKMKQIKDNQNFLNKWRASHPKAAQYVDSQAKLLFFDTEQHPWWCVPQVDDDGRIAGLTEEDADPSIEETRQAQDWKDGNDIRTRTVESDAPKAKPNPYGSTHSANGMVRYSNSSLEKVKREFVRAAQKAVAKKNKELLDLCW